MSTPRRLARKKATYENISTRRILKRRMPAALEYAAANGDASWVKELLSKGARVETRNKKGLTPLLFAVQGGHTEVCKLLLNTGKANVKETTPDGFTPLVISAQLGHTEVCELLIANGSDLEEKDPTTLLTALHNAVGQQSLLQMLLSHKADVNSRSRTGGTPLRLASQEGYLASVATLLHAGADPLLPDKHGGLPIHEAARHNHREVVKILIEQGRCSPDQVRTQTAL